MAEFFQALNQRAFQVLPIQPVKVVEAPRVVIRLAAAGARIHSGQ